VNVPLRLSLREILGGSRSTRNIELPQQDVLYHLKVAIHHSGKNLDNGHYTVAISDQNDWIEYNDEHSRKCGLEEAIEPTGVYVVIYSREN